VITKAGPAAAPLLLSLTGMKSMASTLSRMISRGIILGVLLNAAPALPQSIAEKVEVCATCHGQNGKPIDKTIPIIWGQQAGYIYIQLRDFKRGDRKNHIMQPFEKEEMLASRHRRRMLHDGRSTPCTRWAARAAISIGFKVAAPHRGWLGRAGNTSPRRWPISAPVRAATIPA